MSKQNGKEIAIVVFVESEEVMINIFSLVEQVMNEVCPLVKYAVVCIENEDDLGKLLSPFDPRVLIFDGNLKFIKSQNEYSALEIAFRLCLRHIGSLALIRSSYWENNPYFQGFDEALQKRIFWSENTVKDSVFDLNEIKQILNKAFN